MMPPIWNCSQDLNSPLRRRSGVRRSRGHWPRLTAPGQRPPESVGHGVPRRPGTGRGDTGRVTRQRGAVQILVSDIRWRSRTLPANDHGKNTRMVYLMDGIYSAAARWDDPAGARGALRPAARRCRHEHPARASAGRESAGRQRLPGDTSRCRHGTGVLRGSRRDAPAGVDIPTGNPGGSNHDVE